MPNWCENKLTITGTASELANFYSKIDNGEEFQFLEVFVPTPNDLLAHSSPEFDEERKKENLDKYGARDWYDWRVQNWGTKWDLSSFELITKIQHDEKMQTWVFHFETAWAPPEEAFEKIAAQWPNLIFYISYSEPGMAFCGYAKYQGGEKTETNCVNMIQSFDDYLEELEYDFGYIGNID